RIAPSASAGPRMLFRNPLRSSIGEPPENETNKFRLPPRQVTKLCLIIESFGLRSEEHTSELQSPYDLVCRLLLEKKKIVITLYLYCYVYILFFYLSFFFCNTIDWAKNSCNKIKDKHLNPNI